MNEQIGIDFGTTTSAVCRCTYETDRTQGVQEYVPFNGELYDRTAVLLTGTLTNGFGETVLNKEEKFGWDAWQATGKYPLLESGFKMDLLSEDSRKRDKAMQLTKKYFCHLYRKYSENRVRKKGIPPKKVTTVVTYPTKFPEELQLFLKKTVEEAGFVNVHLINEAQAAMQYALSFDSEETAGCFQNNKKRVLKIMLIDMGAGTTDIAVFEYDTMDPSCFTPIAFYPKQGGYNFGGSEIDNTLYEHYVSKLGADYPKSYSDNGDAVLGERLLREDIKQHKEQRFSALLENHEAASAPVGMMRDARRSPEKPDLRLDREGFEMLLKDYLPQFSALINGALEEAKLTGEEIDLVLLTGGHSQWYFVRGILLNKDLEHQVKLKLTEDRILTFPQPHLVVAKGAAVINPEKKVFLTVVRQGDFYGSIDLTGKLVSPCCWEALEGWHEGQKILFTKRYPMYREGLSRVKRNGQWGCIDQTGMLVIPCQWDDIKRCFEGMLCVKKDEKWGYIDKAGSIVIPCQWDDAWFFSEGLAQVKKDGKWGYIDKTGKVVISHQWDDAIRFDHGLAMVKKNWKWGYIDKTGRVVSPCQWDNAYFFDRGLAMVKKDGKWGCIDKTGKAVIPCQWDNLSYWDYLGYEEGLFRVEKNGKWGFLDKTGCVVSSCQWDDLDYFFHEGLGAVKKNGKWGYIDKTGCVIIPCQWDNACEFSEGLARVKKGEKWGYIDKIGRIVISCQWDNACEFSEGLAAVKKNKKWGYIDQNGREIVPCQWNEDDDRDHIYSSFNEGLARVKKDEKWGYIDKTGSMIIPCQWDEISGFQEGLARIKKDGKWGQIDQTGRIMISCQWDEIGRFELV